MPYINGNEIHFPVSISLTDKHELDKMIENKLTAVEISEGVTIIRPYCFYYCTNLKSVILPNSLTHISSNAFEGCNSLASVIIPSRVTAIGNNAFRGTTAEIYVPWAEGAVSGAPWGTTADKIHYNSQQ